MKRIGPCVCLLIALAGSTLGDDLLKFGLKSAVSAFTPVAEEKSRPALSAADAALRRYVKKSGESHLCQYNASLSSEWIELNGLKLSRIINGVVSDADNANGIRERLMVTVECSMHRSRKPGASSWSPWVNGGPLLLPGAITVEQTSSGNWAVVGSPLKYFNPIGTSITARASMPGGLPPGVHRTVSQQAKNLSPPPPGAGQPAAPLPSIDMQQQRSSPAPGQISQSQAQSQPILMDTRKRIDPGRETEPKGQQPKPFDSVMPLLVVAVVFVSVLSMLLKKSAGRTRSGKSGRSTSPPLPTQRSTTAPPPIPSSGPAPANSSLNLIHRCENLMTPAELAFFAILEPLVRSSYMVSAKVRLADLFQVGSGAGQQSAFNKISRKHIDFVLTDYATSRILCGIELDDSSHKRPDRIERDKFVNEVFERNQLPLLRVPVAWTYYPQALRAELAKAGLGLAP